TTALLGVLCVFTSVRSDPDQMKTVKDDIATAYIAYWEEFLKKFKVKSLGYDGINMSQVMDWHDQQQPPFGPGQKEK
ncbi:MAG: hypothetical protein M1608_15660, partial [Candidatus Omnitrophica bacterium]|nr:hypothetical protein [Candidatus Omnitrophota bacterium]